MNEINHAFRVLDDVELPTFGNASIPEHRAEKILSLLDRCGSARCRWRSRR